MGVPLSDVGVGSLLSEFPLGVGALVRSAQIAEGKACAGGAVKVVCRIGLEIVTRAHAVNFLPPADPEFISNISRRLASPVGVKRIGPVFEE